jgi:hypothetical protein
MRHGPGRSKLWLRLRSVSVMTVVLGLALASCAPQPGPAPEPTSVPGSPAVQDHLTVIVSSPTLAAAQPDARLPNSEVTQDALRVGEATLLIPAAATATPGPAPSRAPVGPSPLPVRTPSGRTQIVMSAVLDYARHHLAVTETITYTNRTGGPLTELMLVAEPNRRPGAFTLSDVRWADGLPVERYQLQGGTLRLTLPVPLPDGGAVGIQTAFDIDVPAGPAPLGYTSRQLNLGDWYLFPPPYRPGQGWLAHEPAAVGEHLVYDLYDFQVDLELAGPAPGPDIAASAPARPQDGRSRYRLEAARSFALSASPLYDTLRSSAGSVTVEVYVFPENRAAGEAALKATVDAVTLYGRLFAPYPHRTLSLVEGQFPDGMEYDGLFFLGREYFAAYDGTPRNYLTALAVHETAHQWWYGLVGNDQALEPWLDEAWATYSELLFYEAVYPDLAGWWWNYRVNRYQPAGWVDSTIYDFRSFRPYVNAVYLRGALFLQALRGTLGDQAFFDLARDLLALSNSSILSTEQFMAIAAEKAGGIERLPVEPFFHTSHSGRVPQ